MPITLTIQPSAPTSLNIRRDARIDYATLGGAEFLVLDGLLEDEFGDGFANYPPGSYLKLPSGESAKLTTTAGCTLFIKQGYPATLDVRERGAASSGARLAPWARAGIARAFSG